MSSPTSFETQRLVRRARTDLGSRAAIADLLRVPRTTVDAWLSGAGGPSPSQQRVLRDLATALDRLRALPRGRVPAGWFRLPCALLDGATPEDVLVVDGVRRVLDAIDRELA
jgi:hypothetical protein